jgi:hypothetical protein
MFEISSPTPLLVVAVVVLTIFFALDLWRRIAEAASILGAGGRIVATAAGIVLGAWLSLMLTATLVPALRAAVTSVPGLSPALLVVLTGALAWLGLAPAFRRAFDAVPMESMMALFYWRAIFGVWLLANFAGGRLPAGFAVPAAFGDMAVTMAAIAILALRRAPIPRWWLLAWNAAGLLDLVGVAVSAATVLRPWAAQRELPGGNFALQLFVVPLFLGLHLNIFARLWREAGSARFTPP